jgi:hypothetical protein
MTALTQSRRQSQEVWIKHQFTLKSGTKAWKGGKCVISPGTGKVIPAVAGVGYTEIGTFDEDIDATSADALVNVNLNRQLTLEYWVNSGTNAIAATDLGAIAYSEDDNVVGISPVGYSPAGRIWGLDSVRGVAVERLASSGLGSLSGLRANQSPAVVFASNDIVIADYPVSGTSYDVPATGAASTISLPANANEGTILYFAADGTKNGHTVQYRDVTTAITAALTASKRHMVEVMFKGAKWYALSTVSP